MPYAAPMYVESVPNRNSPPAILLRESFREGGKTRKRTLANLSHWPKSKIEALRVVLRGGTAIEKLEEAFETVRSLPHGHVAAVLSTARRLGLPRLLSREARLRKLVLAMIVARVIDPRSKLATAQGLRGDTAFSTLGADLELGEVTADHLYQAMDWLLPQQPAIERRLARQHLGEGSLLLYDLTSTYFEGSSCPLAKLGYSRDKIKGKLQINIGLLCDSRGCPIAVEVFEGNVADPPSFTALVKKVHERFKLEEVIFVGDRGMLTKARIREDLQQHDGFDWISSLRAPEIQSLVGSGQLQLSLFDERDLAEITLPDSPDERLIVCRNPLLAAKRARKRKDLLESTERELNKIVVATQRTKRPLKGKDKIGLRVGAVLGRFKMAKHYLIEIDDASFQYSRVNEKIEAEAALDGIYVVRTSVAPSKLGPEEVVLAYKSLSDVERAFRSLKTVDLKIRPIHHRLEDRVRAHVLLCMLAYYVEWHMRQDLAPLLFDDDDPLGAAAERASVVAPAQRSKKAISKARTLKTEDNLPVHSFQTLLKDLATITKNEIQPKSSAYEPFVQVTVPTPLQQKALDLLRVSLRS